MNTTGLNWTAEWIAFPTVDSNLVDTLDLPPPAVFRRRFVVPGKPPLATLYVTALGLADVRINGHRITASRFLPGWSDYDRRVYYHSVPVGKLLRSGTNVIEVTLADGWYAGYVGPKSLSEPRNRALYGDVPALLAQLELRFPDGSRDTIITDDSWEATTGPIRYADLLMGEQYDARREPGPWSTVQRRIFDSVRIEPYPGTPVRPYAEIRPVEVRTLAPGRYLVDMGQNFAGHVRLRVDTEAGDTIRLRHGEMLHGDGSLMTENLRFARATDSYVARGGGPETWEPRFTYHGFRYVEVSGLDHPPAPEDLTGIPLSADLQRTGQFTSSDTLLNRLYENIIWTQRSNFLEVPTDSPQRDERLGWLGDAQIFSGTALYNFDVHDFYRKWLVDVRDAQYDFGAYANFAPRPYPDLVWYSPGWMEAGILVPYHDYLFYGDTSLIGAHYASMERYFDFQIAKSEPYGYFFPEHAGADLNPSGGFGDWLALTPRHISPDLMASLYFAYSLRAMAEMSEALGRRDRARYYQDIYERSVRAFVHHYVAPDGRFTIDTSAYGDGSGYFEGERGFTGHTQAGYATAIYFGVLPDSLNALAGKHLADLVIAADTLPTSGILGIRQLLPALARVGRDDLATAMLLRRDYPGWGFQIANGATTVWERWNSYTREHGFNGEMNTTMNSFNHYAFGAVGQFLYGQLAGIEPATPGFAAVDFRPHVGNRAIREVSAAYQSVHGRIAASWVIEDNRFHLEVTLPEGTTGRVFLPAAIETGTTRQAGYREVGPGTHHFSVTLP